MWKKQVKPVIPAALSPPSPLREQEAGSFESREREDGGHFDGGEGSRAEEEVLWELGRKEVLSLSGVGMGLRRRVGQRFLTGPGIASSAFA